ncbi:hypothetical protein GH733_019291, partial [Mirounga leonina]
MRISRGSTFTIQDTKQVWSLRLLKAKRVSRQNMLQAMVELQQTTLTMLHTLTIRDTTQVTGVLQTNRSRISRIVTAGKRMRDPKGGDDSFTTNLCKEKGWMVSTTRVQDSKADQQERLCIWGLQTVILLGQPRQRQSRKGSNEE